jgi:HSP20 family protein
VDPLDELYREFRELHRQAGGLLCTMAGGMPLPFATPGMRPAVDVYETSDALVIVVEAPGLSESSLEVFLERQYLRVRGYRVRPAPENATRCHRCEIDAGPFDLLIPLPYPPAAGDIKAQFEMGFLRIVLSIPPGRAYQGSPQEQDS